MSLITDLLELKELQGKLKASLEAAQTEVGRRRLLVLNKSARLKPLNSRETELGMALKILTDSVTLWKQAQVLLTEQPLPPGNAKQARQLYKQASAFVTQAQSVLDCKPAPTASDAHPTIPLPASRIEPDPEFTVIPSQQDDSPLDQPEEEEVSVPEPSEAKKTAAPASSELNAILALLKENKTSCDMGFNTLTQAVVDVEKQVANVKTLVLPPDFAEVLHECSPEDLRTAIKVGKWLNDRRWNRTTRNRRVRLPRLRRNTKLPN
jgi:hypothetical protein